MLSLPFTVLSYKKQISRVAGRLVRGLGSYWCPLLYGTWHDIEIVVVVVDDDSFRQGGVLQDEEGLKEDMSFFSSF